MAIDWTYQELAKMIDHSMLKPQTTVEALDAGCRLAVELDVASVCLMPFHLARCAEILAGSTVQPSTTIGFPHGANVTAIKVAESERAIADGGTELDMVVNITRVLSGDWAYVKDEVQAIVDVAHDAGQKVKVIFENCYLEDKHKIRLCEICNETRADWSKTSTGYGSSGATVADIQLMRKHCADHVAVKAAGGMRSLDELLAFRAAGANRCGASATQVVLDEAKARLAKADV